MTDKEFQRLEIGDLVRVDYIDRDYRSWIKPMDSTVGEIRRVIEIDHDCKEIKTELLPQPGNYDTTWWYSDTTWWYATRCLSRVSETKE